jgi:hypothetical protein
LSSGTEYYSLIEIGLEIWEVAAMNDLKEKAYRLIDSVPDEKIAQAIVILEGIKSIIDDKVDEWDLELIKEAQEALKEGDFVPFEDVLKEAGLKN